MYVQLYNAQYAIFMSFWKQTWPRHTTYMFCKVDMALICKLLDS